jgi:biotin-dependent carboxylase-like uncharacterized protein
LIGVTNLSMWDLDRNPPALLRPGTRVRFVERRMRIPRSKPRRVEPTSAVIGLRVLATAFPLLVQDAGRPGQAGQGVSRSGAADLPSLRQANRRVGNPPDTAALEITLGPTRVAVDAPATLALDGASERAEIESGHARISVDVSRPFALDPGEVLVLFSPSRGLRSYLARRGGFDAARALGSAATDTLAGIGPDPLGPGASIGFAGGLATAVDPEPSTAPHLPAPGETVAVPVTLGPRTDWFPADVVASFLAQDWEVTAQSSRVGLRLAGDPLTRIDTRELPSEGTERGAIQVPHSGLPVVFLADHPVTGGYPVIATVQPQGMPSLGQLPPGVRLRFVAQYPFSEIEPSP